MHSTDDLTPHLSENGPHGDKPASWEHFLLLGATALVFRVLVAPYVCYGGDMALFVAWGKRMAELGPAGFYDNGYWCDYLPGYLYALWPFGELTAVLPKGLNTLFFKIPSILADLVTAFLIWRAVKPTEKQTKIWVPAIYLFSPAILANATLWGQADSFHAVFLMAGMFLLVRRRPEWAAVLFAYGMAVKPHAIIILPLAAVYALANRVAWYRVVISFVLVVFVFLLLCLPFADWSPSSLVKFVGERVDTTMGQYKRATVNTFNLWYLLGMNWKSLDKAALYSVPVSQLSVVIFSICYAAAIVWYWVRRKMQDGAAIWEAAAFVYLATFLFVTQVHQRHLFPFFPFAVVALCLRGGNLITYFVLSVTYCINLWLAWIYPQHRSRELCTPWLGNAICAINLITLPLLPLCSVFGDRVLAWLRGIGHEWISRSRREETYLEDSPWIKRRWPVLLGVILLFTLGVRLIRLDTPPERFFDEVYKAYTAEQWVKGNTDAWLWNTPTPDKGCKITWTHPPVPKLCMMFGMKVFGIHPWAWRLPAAFTGTITVLLIFLIAHTLFRQYAVALLAAALAALDSLPLVFSRSGLSDIYLTTLILGAVYLALRSRFILAAIVIGLAAASKWSAVYAFPLIALIHCVWRTPKDRWKPQGMYVKAATYMVVIPIMYLAAYTPFFLAGHGRHKFVELQRQMWLYHTRLSATHPFSSKAWEWPIDRGAVWCYTEKIPEKTPAPANRESGSSVEPTVRIANIYAVGNPVIWITGLFAILYALYETFRRADSRAMILIAAYFLFWAPWLASPRIMFIYHYMPSVHFLYIALAAMVVRVRINRFGVVWLLVLAGLAFAAIYPYATAVPMPESLAVNKWRWP